METHEQLIVKPVVMPHSATGGVLAALQMRWGELKVHPIDLAGRFSTLVFLSASRLSKPGHQAHCFLPVRLFT